MKTDMPDRPVERLASEATVTLNKLMDQLNQIAATNRLPIRQFTEGTLPDLTALIIDGRTTVNKATAVLASLIDFHPGHRGNKDYALVTI